jgi:hypothetical protein
VDSAPDLRLDGTPTSKPLQAVQLNAVYSR